MSLPPSSGCGDKDAKGRPSMHPSYGRTASDENDATSFHEYAVVDRACVIPLTHPLTHSLTHSLTPPLIILGIRP